MLTQGVFYYKAVQGNAVLMKSMYLPDTEREQAIQGHMIRINCKV